MNSELIELYSYTATERETFRYIDRYMVSLGIVEANADLQFSDLGFALAGLFLTYRACNHSGISMTSTKQDIQFPSDTLHFRRLAMFTCLTGYAFGDSRSYLRLANVTWLRLLTQRPDRLLKWIAQNPRLGNGKSLSTN